MPNLGKTLHDPSGRKDVRGGDGCAILLPGAGGPSIKAIGIIPDGGGEGSPDPDDFRVDAFLIAEEEGPCSPGGGDVDVDGDCHGSRH